MGYALGVDLGTTFTAAAVRFNGHAQVAQLGSRRAEIPSLVFLHPDGAVLIGEAAERRGAAEPARLAREFKRRVGDPVPLLVGGAPYPAHALMARLLQEVLGRVATQQEGPPEAVTVTHPANWGPYKRELLEHAVQLADLTDVRFRSEPEAAAVQFAATERVLPGEVVAVYDLGGGTFDAAVLRKTDTGFELLGDPTGVEQLGGVDFDEAILAHVTATLGEHVTGLDPEEPAVIEALNRLRRDCVEAKEALSYDTEVMIPVALPTVHTRIRLNRSEFEAMITPALGETISALHRTLRSAGVSPAEVRSILLAGGSSRIPLVSQLLSVEFGRPLVLDAHPEHSVALGAALVGDPEVTVAQPDWNRDTDELATLAATTETPAVPTPVTPPPAPPPQVAPVPRRRRGPWLAVAAGATAVTLLLAAGAAWVFWPERSTEDGGDSAGPGPPSAAPGTLGAWVRLADLPVEIEAAGVAAYQNRVWVAGGRGADKAPLDSVFVYDPDTGGWTRGPDLPRPVSSGALVAAPWGLYLVGGSFEGGAGSTRVLRLADDNSEWVDDEPLPEARTAGAGAFDGSGVVYIGGTRLGGLPSNRVFKLRDGGGWKTIGKLGSARQRLAAVGNGTDTVWALGGRNQLTNTKYGTVDRIAQGNVFPGQPGVAGPIAPPVDSAAAVGLDSIGVCLVGGETVGPGRAFNDWWCDKPGMAAKLPKLFPQRAGLGAARIGRTVYVVGGYGSGFAATRRAEAYTLPAA